METVIKLEILGIAFTNNGTCSDHVQNTVQKCRRAFYFLSNISMNDLSLNNKGKSHLYSSICLPTLTYGMQSVNLSSPEKLTLNSALGGIIKQMCGLSKCSWHTNLLCEINLDNVSTVIGNYTKSVFKTCVL